ncbi:hypothetical protein [Nocardia vaccinii]|nr:hypothetical protein [Nocardia vaccinii]
MTGDLHGDAPPPPALTTHDCTIAGMTEDLRGNAPPLSPALTTHARTA